MGDEWKYYAGTFGHGELTLAKVKVEFRPDVGYRGAYRFREVGAILFGGKKLLKGLHITVDDAETGLFDDLKSAKRRIAAILEDEIAELSSRINSLEQQKTQLLWIEDV